MDVLATNGWRAAAARAATQHGRITVAQLHACGIGRSGVEKAVAAGRLFREHVGVYALGHPGMTRRACWMSAVLACGPGAALSERSAASLWEFRVAEFREPDVTSAARRRRPGIRVHQAPLEPIEVTIHHGIPVTSPARTAVDMAHALDAPDDVHRLLREMQFRRRFDLSALEHANARRPSALLTQVIQDLRPTDSPLEDAFRRKVLARVHLPEPIYQARIAGFRVDFYWPAARLIVEVDGTAHGQPEMRRADARRDNALQLAGYLVLRYGPADIHRRAAATAVQIERAFSGRRGTRSAG